MAKVSYIALIDGGAGGFGVTFPDLDGCVSWGATQDEAYRNAHEALSLHLEGMAEEGLTIPPPSDLQAIAKVLARRAFANQMPSLYVGVEVEAPDASERVNIYLSKSLLDRIDLVSKERGVNRSAFFTVAAETLMAIWRGDVTIGNAQVVGIAGQPLHGGWKRHTLVGAVNEGGTEWPEHKPILND